MPRKTKRRKSRIKKTRKTFDNKEEMGRLEMERSALEEKNKHLLQIIEEISKPEPENSEPAEDEKEIKVPKAVKTKNEKNDKKSEENDNPEKADEEKKDKPLIGLKEFGEKIETKVKEKLQEGKEKSDLKKDISKMVKDDIDSRFSKLSEDLKKVSDIEKKLKEFTDKVSMTQPVPTPQAVSPEAYQAGTPQPTGLISKGMAAFGEEMDIQSEFLEIKNSIKSLNKDLDNLKKKTDYSITTISDKIKLLDKIPVLEENFQSVSEKLGPDNVQKMRKLIFSADELVDEVIPDLVGKKMRVRMGPMVNEIRNLKHNIEGVRKAMDQINVEVLNLKKTKEDIKALEIEKDRLYKEIIGRDAKFREGVDILKGNIKKKMDAMSAEFSEKLDQSQIDSYKKIEKDTGKIFSDVIQLKLSEMDKNHADISERIRKMGLDDEQLSKRITELKAPEGVKKWVGSQLKDVYESTIPEIKSIKKEILNYLEQMKSLREGIKNLDSFSLDLSKTSEIHKEKIEKLVAEKKSLADMMEKLKSEIRILDERFLMEKQRISELEADVKTRETDFRTNLDKQKSDIADFRLEVVKMIESSMKTLKDELEEERMEDIMNQTNELKSDILRIEKLKTELDDYRKKQELKLDKMVSDLKDLPPEIKMLSGRIGSLETLAKNLGKDKINESEFSSIIKLVTKRIGEIEDHFDEIEKDISKDKSRIEGAVNDLLSDDRIMKSAQELIGKDLDGKIQDMTKSMSSDITSLSENLKENSDTIAYLKEKYNVLESLTEGVPKKLESQEIFINKIMESKDSLAKKAEALAAELKSLSGKISVDKDRLMALEQKTNLQDKEKESRISSVADDLAKTSENLSSDIESVKAKLDEIGALGKSLNEKSVTESEFISTVKSISKRIDDVENLYTKLDKESSLDKTKLQAAINQALSDDKVLKSAQESLGKWIDENIQDMNKKISSNLENISSKIEERAEDLNKKIYSDIEKLTAQANENYESIVNMREKLPALDSLTMQSGEHDDMISSLKEKVQILNSLTKEFPKRFDKQATELRNLLGSSGFLAKSAESLESDLNNLSGRLGSELEKLTTLEKEFRSQSKSNEKRMDSVDSTLAQMKSNAQGSTLQIGILKEKLEDMEKRFEQSLKKSSEEKHQLREELKKQGERVGRIIKELSE